MDVLITSFQRSHGLGDVPVWSAAVYSPRQFTHYPKAWWTDIRNEDGAWTRPRDFVDRPDPLGAYRAELLRLYRSREEQARAWVSGVDDWAALCCWCPYDRAAQRQLEEHGSFVCHTAVVGEFLEELGVRVWYDQDRRRMKDLTP